VLTALHDSLNSTMDVEGFKRIFYMEWAHRVLGRIIGVAFLLPFGYFAVRGVLTRHMPARLGGMTLLIGAQGALGWYMVKSGLEDELLRDPAAVPRVSQYRLAAHLGTAFVLYGTMFWNGIATLQDWRHAQGKLEWAAKPLATTAARRFRFAAKSLTGLVFLTAMSGKDFYFYLWIVGVDIAPSRRFRCRPGRRSSVQRIPTYGRPPRPSDYRVICPGVCQAA
jgi:cytochrome c oxidase assembly protein subunit 15